MRGHSATKDRLSSERRRLERIIADIERSGRLTESASDSTGELAPCSQHLADVATETFEREFDVSLVHELRAQVAEIAAAQERIEHGRYGVCEVCGEAIGSARLAAVPATRYCLRHQEAAERAMPFDESRTPHWMTMLNTNEEFLSSDDESDERDEGWDGPETDAVHTCAARGFATSGPTA
jgi:RNA polymerase-binding transcription factor DksA